jgi:hypothetical protein
VIGVFMVLAFLKSKWTVNIIFFVFSAIVGILLYVEIFMDILPIFLANLEDIEESILAMIIVDLSV